jgi:hypothetical protein
VRRGVGAAEVGRRRRDLASEVRPARLCAQTLT